jgi:anti-sigma regulatory factor (Ser/Thr protein kinase)
MKELQIERFIRYKILFNSMAAHKGELLNLNDLDSLVRLEFDKEVYLNDYDLRSFNIPKSFRNFSFTPKKGFDLTRIMESLKKDLIVKGASIDYINKTIPGVCEALKNAYEHGNLENNDKKIFLARHFSKKNIEYVVGDEGGLLDGNFFPYALSIMDNKKEGSLDSSPDFYSFCGRSYAPKGHSGVGTKTINKCFDNVEYFKNEFGGLSVYLGKNSF